MAAAAVAAAVAATAAEAHMHHFGSSNAVTAKPADFTPGSISWPASACVAFVRLQRAVAARLPCLADACAQPIDPPLPCHPAAHSPLLPLIITHVSQERDTIRLKREAKTNGGFYVEPEAKLAFVMRIRGLNKIHPKVRQQQEGGHG
jgi:hypothetical protein